LYYETHIIFQMWPDKKELVAAY